MYRLTLLLGLIYVSEGTWWRHGRHHNHHHGGYHMHGYGHDHNRHCHHWNSAHDQFFEKLTTSVIQFDKFTQDACKKYSNVDTREILDTTEYKLIYTMKQCDTNKTVVQIKHRVIYMNAQSTGDDKSNFYDVRILPTLLKTKNATWVYKDDELSVIIPYDVEIILNSDPKETCVEANEEVITVPKAPPFQYRFSV